MLCFLRFFASMNWRIFSNRSSKKTANAKTVRDMRIGRPTKIILVSIGLFLNSFVSLPLLAAEVPGVPGPISASDGGFLDIVRLTWADVVDETEYQVFRCDTATVDSCGEAIELLPANTTQYDDIGTVSIGGKHYYRLTSCNSVGCSDFSEPDIGFTKLIFSNGYDDETFEITGFTVNGESEVILPIPLNGPVDVQWSTRSAESCMASSSPNLDDWNATVSISTYGPISVQLPGSANSYNLSLNCFSALGSELSKTVEVTVGNVPDAPTLNTATGGDESVELVFTPNNDGGSAISGYTAKCGAAITEGPSSPITVIGLTNGISYQCSVIATNLLGDSIPSDEISATPKTTPDTPTLLNATGGDENAVLTFTTDDDDGGSDLTGYTASCGASIVEGSTSPITVTGLTNGILYQCSVFASNAVGDSAPSTEKPVTPMTTPDTPTLLTAIGRDEIAVLTFTTDDDDGGSDLTGYTASCGAIIMEGSTSPITVTGLTNGVPYQCSVFASNAVGNSAPSNEIPVTPITRLVASIEEFDITTNGDQQPLTCGDTNIDFNWSAKNVYRCYGSWMESDANPDGELDGSVNQATNTLFGSESVLFEDFALTQSFTLQCKNESGDVVVQQSKAVEVQAPCLTTRLESWKSMFTRDWHGPRSFRPYVRISGDKVMAIKFNTGPVFEETRSSSPITVTGLMRGSRYSCSVVANNTSGESPSSNLEFFNPVESVPEAPTLESVTAGDGSAELTFTARDELFAITSYRAKCGDYTKTGSSSPITVNNLTNGTVYGCSVSAINEVGTGESSEELAVTPAVQSMFVASAKGKSQTFQASPGTSTTLATIPLTPTLNSHELGHLSVELTFDDDDPTASDYTASCRISTFGGLGTIEFGGTRGERLLAISTLPGNFQVADECRQYQYLSDWLIWKTEGSDREGTTCDLEPNTDYYWNLTFTDGVNKGTSSCAGTPCQTYIRISNTEYVN